MVIGAENGEKTASPMNPLSMKYWTFTTPRLDEVDTCGVNWRCVTESPSMGETNDITGMLSGTCTSSNSVGGAAISMFCFTAQSATTFSQPANCGSSCGRSGYGPRGSSL